MPGKHRKDLSEGMVLTKVSVSEEMVDALVTRGYLAANERTNFDAVGRAIQTFISRTIAAR